MILARRYSTNILKQVNPFSKIKVTGNLSYRIKPVDLFECQDSNLLRASIIDPSKGNLLDKIKVNVTKDVVEIEDTSPEPAWCMLEVPIKADLDLTLTTDADIENLYCDLLKVVARFVRTNNLNTKTVQIHTKDGGVACQGLLLGQHIDLRAFDGDMELNKIQGEKLVIKQSNGTISTNSIYSKFSTFACENSKLNLKNIHQLCHVTGIGKGELNMNGFYGTLLANLEDYRMNLQLSELIDESKITSKNTETAFINVAEKVLEDCYFCIKSGRVIVDQEIQALNLKTSGDSDHITLNKDDLNNQLIVRGGGDVVLGRLAWADTFDFSTKLKSFGETQFH